MVISLVVLDFLFFFDPRDTYQTKDRENCREN